MLRADSRQAVPAGLAGDKAARQAIKDKWTAVNKALAEAQPQQVGLRRRMHAGGGGGKARPRPQCQAPLCLHPALHAQAWAVPDPALRFALRDALAEQVLPLYDAFFAKYRQAPYSGARARTPWGATRTRTFPVQAMGAGRALATGAMRLARVCESSAGPRRLQTTAAGMSATAPPMWLPC
jgi:hypothetical protein